MGAHKGFVLQVKAHTDVPGWQHEPGHFNPNERAAETHSQEAVNYCNYTQNIFLTFMGPCIVNVFF
jgi:hypothetical protein